ncbi:MAG TPA: TAT-variant-translocated molybdopterin oxidoreductase [Phycisphaerae bacterium]|nr:TAT-variant-translocated molybdopterin oxidoreductase [Phycisphaerae bacterium]HNU46526.1 TAT-variant-translocated molybdopterin oxidoreductase [Phycisphaerae bacterium]
MPPVSVSNVTPGEGRSAAASPLTLPSPPGGRGVVTGETGTAYWRSLDELADTPQFRQFLEAEFPESVEALRTPATRRQFLQLMAASLALAGVTGCRWPVDTMAPLTKRPAGRLPGVPVHYATVTELGGSAQGLVVTCYDGRPIKIDGNPNHPINLGATDSFAQAGVLEMYDPDRSRTLIQRERQQESERTWPEFVTFMQPVLERLRSAGGSGLAVLSEASSSPTVARLRRQLLTACPQARWYEYEPISADNEREGARLAFGSPHRTQLELAKAQVIVSLDADLLGCHPAAVKHARDFVAGRQVDRTGRRVDYGGRMNRLYVVESGYSITGAQADHRLAVPPTVVPAVAGALANELRRLGMALGPWAEGLPGVADAWEFDRALVQAMARDLVEARGRGLIAVGPRQPAPVHALVHGLNAALGGAGTTVRYTPELDPDRPTHAEAIQTLADELAARQVDTLLILGGNPAFDAPADLDFARRLETVATTSVHLSLHRNETSRACTWHVPRAHCLESWGDARARDGTVSVIQPCIEPLYGGKTSIELLALLAGELDATGIDMVRETIRSMRVDEDFEAIWGRTLHDGVLANSAWKFEQPEVRFGPWVEQLASMLQPPPRTSLFEVEFVPDRHVYDGRFANHGWLQELPDPLTRLTWDNAALISPADARQLGVQSGDVLQLSRNGRTLALPAFVMPGQALRTLTLSLGYGRTAAGHVGDGTGFNTYTLRTTDALHVATGVTVKVAGGRCKLAVTQDHHAIRSALGEREKAARSAVLVREATLGHYLAHPDFAAHLDHHPPLISLWREHDYREGHRWGMVIDLNACIGCGTCVIACQAENNVPVVGKDEVDRGREMHWLRVDRYFRGDPSSPRVVHQPLTCHHCENAPCEQVCPVAATVHSAEGLNDMVYNRCIGTRYCSNNCPFKVRRFNWFNNHKGLQEVEELAFNPEVTVRGRGVMEKCTFCVQRISAVKIAAGNDRRPIRDGEVVPACAQACPTSAIHFGDLNDPTSRVARLQAHDRGYVLLAELNIKPRTKYLARLTNPAAEARTAT